MAIALSFPCDNQNVSKHSQVSLAGFSIPNQKPLIKDVEGKLESNYVIEAKGLQSNEQ